MTGEVEHGKLRVLPVSKDEYRELDISLHDDGTLILHSRGKGESIMIHFTKTEIITLSIQIDKLIKEGS